MSTEEASPGGGDPPPGGEPTRRMVTGVGALATIVFLAIWLVPITYVGSFGRDIRWMPRDLRHLHRVACLFTKEVGAWGTYHVEIRPEAGADWVELPLPGYFDMSIFGYRTRFHRLVGKSYRRSGGAKRGRYMAQWIVDRYAELNPGRPKVAGVRYVSVRRPVKDLLKEKGRFRKIPLAKTPARRKRVILTFEGEELRYVPRKRRSGRRGGAALNRPPNRPPNRPEVTAPKTGAKAARPRTVTRPPSPEARPTAPKPAGTAAPPPTLQPVRPPSGAAPTPPAAGGER